MTHRGALLWSTPSISPALIGVGYVIGFELGAINFAGGVLAWFVLVPFALFVDPDLAARLHGASGAPPLSELVYTIWYNQIRPIAVGAMLVGACWTLFRMRDSLAEAFRGAVTVTPAVPALATGNWSSDEYDMKLSRLHGRIIDLSTGGWRTRTPRGWRSVCSSTGRSC